MTFCGQCGFQLPPGATRCPRCGTPVDVDVPMTGSAHTDDPTIASPSLRTGQQSQSGIPPMTGPYTPNNPQQKLVLGPDGGNFNTQQRPYDPTSQMNVNNYPTNTPSYGGYGMQGGGNYQTQNVPPNYATNNNAGNYQTSTPFSGSPQQQDQYNYQQQEVARRNSRGRLAGLALALVGIVLILGAIILFMTHHSAPANTGNVGPSPQATLSATQQAQTLIQQYYANINQHNYTAAYAFWQSYPDSEAAFAKGFQNTLHDQLTINQTTQQADGTVSTTVTVNATELAANGGQKQSVYHLKYIFALQADHSWKIKSGTQITP